MHLERHLSTEELGRRYREARDRVERSHYQVIWLLSCGKSTREVMEATGYTEGWIRQIAHRYNQHGTEGVGDRRHHNPGGSQRALLSPQLREELGQVLQAPPPDGGLWTSRKVAEWIEGKLGRRVGVQRGWEYLRGADHTPQLPRPSHAKADPQAQEEFRKNSPSG